MIINILGCEYTIIDTKEKMTVADSFVKRQNKIGTAHGEAKFYIGNNNEELRDFFGNRGFEIKAFILKKDLIQYLKDASDEYQTPEQEYINKENLPQLWIDRNKLVEKVDDILFFELKDQIQIEGPRVYVKSDDLGFDIIRELSLPNITYVSAIKLQDKQKNIIYYLRLFVDYFGELEHPLVVEKIENEINKETIKQEDKIQLVKARVGQGKYRKALLDECPYCPITMVTDDRLLIASHIKPWAISDEVEKVDPKNGFMFTPTFDFLFDRGFISFSNDKKMQVSPWLSKMTCSRLNLIPNKKYEMLPIEDRLVYLEYHRKNIFKG